MLSPHRRRWLYWVIGTLGLICVTLIVVLPRSAHTAHSGAEDDPANGRARQTDYHITSLIHLSAIKEALWELEAMAQKSRFPEFDSTAGAEGSERHRFYRDSVEDELTLLKIHMDGIGELQRVNAADAYEGSVARLAEAYRRLARVEETEGERGTVTHDELIAQLPLIRVRAEQLMRLHIGAQAKLTEQLRILEEIQFRNAQILIVFLVITAFGLAVYAFRQTRFRHRKPRAVESKPQLREKETAASGSEKRSRASWIPPTGFALALGIFAADLQLPLGVAVGILYSGVVLLALWSPRRSDVLTLAAVGIVFTIAGYFLSAPTTEPWKALANRVLSIYAIGCLSVVAFLRGQIVTALHDSETRLRTILDSAAEGIYGIDREGITTFVNPAAARMIDRERGELIGKPHHENFHYSQPDGSEYLPEESPIYATLIDGQAHRIENEVLRRSDGSSFPVEYISAPSYEKGRLSGAVVSFRDIAARQKVESLLRSRALEANLLRRATTVGMEQECLDEVLESCLNLVCETMDWAIGHVYSVEDEPDVLVPTSRWYCREANRYARFRYVTNRTRFAKGQGLVGKVFASGQAAWIPNIDTEAGFVRAECCREVGLTAALAFPIKSGNTVHAVLEFFFEKAPNLDQEFLDLMTSVGTQLGESHERLRAREELRIAKQVEQGLREAKSAAEAADRSKSEFLANMSHEIRTPMTAILGYADEILLTEESEGLAPGWLEAANSIKRNGMHLLQIVNDVLDLSKIAAGRLEIERMPIPLRSFLLETASLMRDPIEGKGLELSIEFPTPIPETLMSDPTRLRQILMNLLGNASKFTERGKIRLVARLLEDGADGKLQLEVVDSGIGIAQEDLSRLFRPFEQADGSTTRRYGGTGLGLSICHRLVTLLGGSIEAHSELGRGSCFRVILPLPQLTEPTTVQNNSLVFTRPEAMRAEDTPIPPDIRLECRILVAEDNPDIRMLVRQTLERAGAQVESAENGQIAVEYALKALENSEPFDLILMDMQMPVLDGYEATLILREADYPCPIIALTAHAMSTDRERYLQAGCADYVPKPVDRTTLIATLWRQLAATRP